MIDLQGNGSPYDTHSFLGLWLEYDFDYQPEQNDFIFNLDDFEGPIPIRIKEKVRNSVPWFYLIICFIPGI
jgi:hypothetical protein